MIALAASSLGNTPIASFNRHFRFRLHPRNPLIQAAVSPSSSSSSPTASSGFDLSSLESAINKVNSVHNLYMLYFLIR